MFYYENAFINGEAPDNLLAVENVATAANKPGWLMQADVLSPLAPVTAVRSDKRVGRSAILLIANWYLHWVQRILLFGCYQFRTKNILGCPKKNKPQNQLNPTSL